MYLVGLTGGIGSGKSTVAELLAARGAIVLDADEIAREVVAAGTTGFDEVVSRFGPDVVASRGELDRDALAAIVFDDADARQDLNAIVHPRVGERILTVLGELEDRDVVCVLDVPLLVESGMDDGCDAVVVVTAPPDVRVARLARDRDMSEEDAHARIRAQASDADRLAAATHVIENIGTLEDLADRVDEVADDLWQHAGVLESSPGTSPPGLAT